jgi:acetyltransferase-like isoleucine patch superfamily enzyme
LISKVRALSRATAITLARVVGPLFFRSIYLRGRYFEVSTQGWRWVLQGIWFQRILGFNRHVPWPTHPSVTVHGPQNIRFHVDSLNCFQSPGCYFQAFAGRITIGKTTYIGPNVGIITANHDPTNLDAHLTGQDVVIGDRCWIGMNAVIMPGVRLGDRTIVGAGAIVTKSFTSGDCVVAGNPGRIIKQLRTEAEA